MMSVNKTRWVAIDLGKSTVKASVLGENNKPIRLQYHMRGYETTLLSSVVYRHDDNVTVGDYASLLGAIDPSSIEINWMSSNTDVKKTIAKSIFETIKHAASMHYDDSNIGVVLLHDDKLDIDVYDTARAIFSNVKTMTCFDVLQNILFPNINKPVLVMDFGDSAFKLSLMDKNNKNDFFKNEDLGFHKIDMFSLINFEDISSLTNRETRMLSELMQRIKILANNGENIILPHFVKCDAITNKFQQKMTTYFYQCFDECSNALKRWSKSWDDISDVIFIGGGAHSTIINSVFNKYLQSCHIMIESYNNKNINFDAQFAATHCAIQMPELRQNNGVILQF